MSLYERKLKFAATFLKWAI